MFTVDVKQYNTTTTVGVGVGVGIDVGVSKMLKFLQAEDSLETSNLIFSEKQ